MELAHRKERGFNAAGSAEIELQDASLDIWDKKYRLKTKDGQVLDVTIGDTYERIARALAEVESSPEKREEWYDKFLWALRHGAIPAGRIVSNAGAMHHKPATSTINCTVSGLVRDSMADILEKVNEAGLTLKAGCGIGYEFSTLRPKGAYVSGAGAYTSGPLSFMDIYDKMCFTVSSAGGPTWRADGNVRCGSPGCPRIHSCQTAKMAVCVNSICRSSSTEDFMSAMHNDDLWPLAFPLTPQEVDNDSIDLDDPEVVVWRDWPTSEGYVTGEDGRVGCKIHRTIKARRLWDAIMTSTYDFAEPGFILIDEVNDMNNNWFCENIRATNPCGEQPLPPYGSCLLGSVNLTKFVVNPFSDHADFDWETFRETVAIFTRMLDNVVEINGLPLEPQRREIQNKRRHGMGFLGLGSTITMLCHKYGSETRSHSLSG